MTQRFEIEGAPRAMASLQAFISRAENFVTIAPEIHRFLIDHTKDVFSTEGAAGGVKWPKYRGNDEIYGLVKGRQLHPAKAMLLRWAPKPERLYPSLVEPSHKEHIFAVSGKSIRFGTSVPYAHKHQHGTGVGPYGEPIPKRQFLALSPRQVAEIRRIISRHMGI